MNTVALTPDVPASFRDSLRGFGPFGVAALGAIVAAALVFMPIAAVLILLWAWASKTPWRDLGLARPRSWVGGLALGIALGVALKLVLKALVMPLFGAPPATALYHDLVGNTPAVLKFAVYAILGAGFAEELVFRGYLFERAARLFGTGRTATVATALAVTALFGAAHWQQGIAGVANATIAGLVAALLFLAAGRNLFAPVVMHAAFDLTAGVPLYLNLENPISHLVFK
ncbi:MAG: CPBP family intramembrane glutamic endopeptidase [Rhizomicrobium sp.]